jgi:glyoxylase-like metal-dependent hydrolase (beta-lactamase superfamily II)/8-oxo-dGTP pyrophosphatase MutT (NUDIX family)
MEIPVVQPRPTRYAATMIVVRESPAGVEVLMLRRAGTSDPDDHNSGAWVFPGGVVDASDRQWHVFCNEPDDGLFSARLGLSSGGLDFHVAAIRECFEEAGLLFATTGDGSLVNAELPLDPPLIEWRSLLHRGERTLGDLCERAGLKLSVDRLMYLSHWLTPVGRAKRFDTRFFLAIAPTGQTPMHDGIETVESRWVSAADALVDGPGALKLLTPTRSTLTALARFDSLQALLDWAQTPRKVMLTLPRLATGSRGLESVSPQHGAWAELGRLDPAGLGRASHEIRPGVAVRLSLRVIRVTAPNAGMMTGPGTNSYLVGGGPRNEWAVIDPGPAQTDAIDALLAATPGPIRWIFVTHTHVDHSPGAALLKERTGAQVHGQLPAYPHGQDPGFTPDQRVHDGDRFTLGDGVTLRAIHTPGHASNHFCYLLEEEKTLFTGDHVMQGSTVVIRPPDGDMSAYLASLRMLLSLDVEWLAPGHGFLISPPAEAIESLLRHRLRREAKVVSVLHEFGPTTIETLLKRVYDDVDPRLHRVAQGSLEAHLIRLQKEQVATHNNALWSAGAAS